MGFLQLCMYRYVWSVESEDLFYFSMCLRTYQPVYPAVSQNLRP